MYSKTKVVNNTGVSTNGHPPSVGVGSNVKVSSDVKEDEETAFASVVSVHPTTSSYQRNQRTKISYAILLFDHDNNVLVIKRPTSYAFSSFFNYLCTLDQYNYEALLNEFTLEERDLLRQYWRSDGLEPLIKIYLNRAFPSASGSSSAKSSAIAKEEDRIRTLLERKFKVNRTKMQTRWNSLIQINNMDNLPTRTCPRMYGFAKVHGPDNKKWTLSREQFIYGVGCPPPSDAQFKQWMPTTYCSNDGFQYSFELMVGSCHHFELPPQSRAAWIRLSDISSFDDLVEDVGGLDDLREKAYFVPEVVEALKRMHSIAIVPAVRTTEP